MNRTFLVTSIRESWDGSIPLAEQLILQSKMAGASAVLLDLNCEKMTREAFVHLKNYADKFNLAVVVCIDSKESLELIRQMEIKIHIISNEILQKPVLCATLIQTGIPALVPISDNEDFVLGDDFKNVKYLKRICDENSIPKEFKENLVGIIIDTSELAHCEEALKRGCKIIVLNLCLDRDIHNKTFVDFENLLQLRKSLNKIEKNAL